MAGYHEISGVGGTVKIRPAEATEMYGRQTTTLLLLLLLHAIKLEAELREMHILPIPNQKYPPNLPLSCLPTPESHVLAVIMCLCWLRFRPANFC